jgi:murein DD-endopeptidase MepM/ murein hydrolase activator NlpD
VFARTGTPLVAVSRGIVLETGDDGGRGNYVAIFSPESRRTYVYLHMNEPSRVARGRWVEAGQRLGGVGCTGSCSGDHLHFEIRRGRGLEGPARNPMPVLRRWAAGSGARATLPPGAH